MTPLQEYVIYISLFCHKIVTEQIYSNSIYFSCKEGGFGTMGCAVFGVFPFESTFPFESNGIWTRFRSAKNAAVLRH